MSRYAQIMIKIVGDSDGGGSKRKMQGGGIYARKGAISMRRTGMSLLATSEAKRMYSCLHSRGSTDFSDTEGYEHYSVRSLLPSISITPSSSVSGATPPTTNIRSGVHPFTNFDLLSHDSTAMSSETGADARDLHRAQQIEIVFSPITSTPETH